MSVRDDIEHETKEAMKGRDRVRVEALRMLTAALKNAEIEKGQPLAEDEEIAILGRQLKQREESADAFRKAGREERAISEEAEAEIVRRYLPAPLSEEELERIVDETIREVGATSMKDMGTVMALTIERSGDRADGKRLAQLVRARLQ